MFIVPFLLLATGSLYEEREVAFCACGEFNGAAFDLQVPVGGWGKGSGVRMQGAGGEDEIGGDHFCGDAIGPGISGDF